MGEGASLILLQSSQKILHAEEKKVEEENKEKVEEEKKEEDAAAEIVLRVDMHCEGCARKVAKSLRGFQGVEEVQTDSKARKVVVKGKTADPVKVCERIQKKIGRKVEIISPLPKLPDEVKEEAKETPPEENMEELKPITVVLKVRMHCAACAQLLQKRIKKMDGVQSVETDLSNNQVIVKGFLNPANLVDNIYQKTRKQASIVPEEEKKENKSKEEKKEEKSEEEEKEDAKEEDEKKLDVKKIEYFPPKFFLEYSYAYPPEIFSDENPNACSIM